MARSTRGGRGRPRQSHNLPQSSSQHMAAKSAYDALAAPFTTWVLGPKFVRNSSCSRAGQAACRVVVGPRCPPKASELPSTPTKVGRPNCVACSGHPLPTRFVMVEMIGSVCGGLEVSVPRSRLLQVVRMTGAAGSCASSLPTLGGWTAT
eukprot:scaffold120647_cov63-Phaeocystis_antarctica.AAC.2